jgi:hypothetical protein
MVNIFSSQPSTIKNADKKRLLEKVQQPIDVDVYGTEKPSTIKNADKKTLLEKVPQPIEFDVYGTDSCGNISTEKIMCHSCHKKFLTKNSLTRHEANSPVCLKWLSQEPKG